MAKFNIDSQFTLEGAFMLPSDPPIQIAGRLKTSSAGVTLERSAYVVEFKEAFPTEIRRYDVVQGVTLDGDCTLFDLFERPGTRIFLEDGNALTTAEYVVNECVMGLRLRGQKTKEIEAAAFVFSGLAEWFSRGPDRKIDGDTITVTHPIGSMPIVECMVAPIAANIGLRLAFPSQHKPTEYSVISTPTIVVKPNHPLCQHD